MTVVPLWVGGADVAVQTRFTWVEGGSTAARPPPPPSRVLMALGFPLGAAQRSPPTLRGGTRPSRVLMARGALWPFGAGRFRLATGSLLRTPFVPPCAGQIAPRAILQQTGILRGFARISPLPLGDSNGQRSTDLKIENSYLSLLLLLLTVDRWDRPATKGNARKFAKDSRVL